MRDTSPKAEAIQREILRRMSGAERLELAFQMSEDIRRLRLDGIRYRHPEWTDEQVKKELIRLTFLPDEPPEALR